MEKLRLKSYIHPITHLRVDCEIKHHHNMATSLDKSFLNTCIYYNLGHNHLEEMANQNVIVHLSPLFSPFFKSELYNHN